MTQPALLPVPPDFAFEWANDGDEQFFWMQDRMHLPNALTPLDASMVQASFSVGASNAIAKLSMPITGLRAEVYGGYTYLSPQPFIGTPEEAAARFEEMKRITGELGMTVLNDWRETFEPQVLAECDEILDYDYEGPTTAQVAAHVAGFYDRLVKLWDIHMRVNIPPMNAVFGLEDFLGQLVGEDAIDQARLTLQGFENKSVETGHALWLLSRWVREDDSLAAAVAASATVDGVVSVDHARSGEFDERWQAYLDSYGWRSNRFIEISWPTWREEQSTALTQLKGFMGKPDGEDPFIAHREQAEERDKLVAALEARVPEPARGDFRALLAMAQQYIPIAEDHNFTIDQKAHAVIRHGVQQFGKRLVVDGVVEGVEDVFFLTLDEIRGIAGGGDGAGLKALVTERRAIHARQEAMEPPPFVGTPPPEDAPPDPLVTKFFGIGAPPSTDEKVINGLACSAGVVEGTAKVLLSLDEADKLEHGDIMVCKATMPAWTPLFGIAGAIVADAGGPLSHCAIVAREYKIPCVAGTQVATAQIKDGMRLRVDGSAGTVEILD
ncbi:MAG: PEP-utilizing enzyme [Dehalococcoidia bacterium]